MGQIIYRSFSFDDLDLSEKTDISLIWMTYSSSRCRWEPYSLHDLSTAHVSLSGSVLQYADPAQTLTTGGGDIDDLDHDLSEVLSYSKSSILTRRLPQQARSGTLGRLKGIIARQRPKTTADEHKSYFRKQKRKTRNRDKNAFTQSTRHLRFATDLKQLKNTKRDAFAARVISGLPCLTTSADE